jgi:hypothetical protein
VLTKKDNSTNTMNVRQHSSNLLPPDEGQEQEKKWEADDGDLSVS